MRFKYYRDYEGGFIADEENQVQLLDFRQNMGDEYGEKITKLLNKEYTPKLRRLWWNTKDISSRIWEAICAVCPTW